MARVALTGDMEAFVYLIPVTSCLRWHRIDVRSFSMLSFLALDCSIPKQLNSNDNISSGKSQAVLETSVTSRLTELYTTSQAAMLIRTRLAELESRTAGLVS